MSRPTYDVFLVTPFDNAKGERQQRWTKVGVAFSHKDECGFSINFHVTPSADNLANGNIVLRDVNTSHLKKGGTHGHGPNDWREAGVPTDDEFWKD